MFADRTGAGHALARTRDVVASGHLPPDIRSFLAESQRRVLAHCHRLLTAPDLAAEYRTRLTRLAGIVEADLQSLVE